MVNCSDLTCGNEVDFCCTVVVPSNFTLNGTATVGIETSALKCVVEQCTQQDVSIPDPCDGENPLSCDVVIDVVKAEGCIPFYLAQPVTNSSNGTSTSVGCTGTVCVDRILCSSCSSEGVCDGIDFDTSRVTNINSPIMIGTSCNDTIYEISGTITLPSCPAPAEA
ncbi:hypothetical protein [Pontibacillus marinus]|uniref:DUF281 domain-containing protein n=1 Tax=Pontibacillus marinus BH030004 = DSM 16465 TaxID=1385511 RepID=A0A0A5GGD8_9BACI|nr:hypothetical protein [Pontibacillus marinus]KGX90180.1 hypothetical protein N783_01425 [Pontibacillus marinus BH030004 = DSM 16465]